MFICRLKINLILHAHPKWQYQLWCLSVSQKKSSPFASLLRYCIIQKLHLKLHPAIWLDNSIWAHNARPRILPDGEISITISVFILDYFRRKLMANIFKKSGNPYFGTIFGPFCPNLGKKQFSWKKKTLSVFKYSNYLSPCKKSEKTNEPFLEKRQTVGQTDRQRWFYRTCCATGF